jgi:hypothetical protein
MLCPPSLPLSYSSFSLGSRKFLPVRAVVKEGLNQFHKGVMNEPGVIVLYCYPWVRLHVVGEGTRNIIDCLMLTYPSFTCSDWVFSKQYWMIYRGPGFLSVVWFGSSPTLSTLLSPLPSVSSTGDTQEGWERVTTCWRVSGRVGSRIIPQQGSLVFSKSFKTLWVFHYQINFTISWEVYQRGVGSVYSAACCSCLALLSSACFGLTLGCLAFLQVQTNICKLNSFFFTTHCQQCSICVVPKKI